MAPRILICGGGYVGLYSALSLQRHLKRSEAELTLVSPDMNMTYQPFMPEAAAGNIEPRHAVVPLRGVLKRVRVITGSVEAIDHDAKKARVAPIEGEPYDISYDHVVIGLGSISRVLPVPGLAERGIGFKTVAEAIYLRNKVLSCMDIAESTSDANVRRKALTFVFVGGGYAGVEALAELEDLSRYAARRYATVSRDDMRWVLVEAASGILPEIGDELGRYALERLRERGIEVHLETRLTSAERGVMSLSDGTTLEAETLVWTTGVEPHPALQHVSLPKDDRGRLLTDEYLRVRDVDAAWAAGDCAAVPDLARGGTAPPTAQHALREARRLGENLAATLQGRELKRFHYRQLGTLVSLGRYKGVARVLGLRLKGFPAWFLHRTYHVLMIPTLNRKGRVIVDWTGALFFKRDVVQLGSLQAPRDAFTDAAGGKEQGQV